MGVKKILITGATGYVGSHLRSHLLNQSEYPIIEFVCSSEDFENILDDLIDTRLDYIFHLAAKTGAGDFYKKFPGDQYTINEYINSKILLYWRKYWPKAKFITMGTSFSYSDNHFKIEKNYMKRDPESGHHYYYAMMKRNLLLGLQALNKQDSGLKFTYYIPSVFAGISFRNDMNHYIFDLTRKICDAKYADKEPVILWGNGKQKRELIYIQDACRIMSNHKDDFENEVVNLSPGETLEIQEYAKIICNKVDYDFKKIQFDKSKPSGAKEKKLINTKLKDQYFTPVNKVIDKIVEYYIKEKNYV